MSETRAIENFYNALTKLHEVAAMAIVNDHDRAGIVQLFNFTFEPCWKTFQRIAVEQGIAAASPRQALQAAMQLTLIAVADEETWLEMLRDRNMTSNRYREELAREIADRVVGRYLDLLNRAYQSCYAWTFEREQLNEIQQESPQAIGTGDAEAPTTLPEELESKEWREPPPENLVCREATAQAESAGRQGRAAISQVEKRLYEAHAALDVEAGRLNRQRLNQLCRTWTSAADKELMDRIGPALHWLDQQTEREARQEAAIAALEQAISDQVPKKELTRLHREAKVEGEVPSAVEKRYRELLATRQRTATRRVRWATAAIMAVLLVAVATVVGLVLHKWHQDDVAIASQTLDQLLNDGNVAEARNYLDQLAAESPGVADHQLIMERGARLQKMLTGEDTRRHSFLTAVGAVRTSLEEQLPDRDALARADKLATSEEEKTMVRRLDAEIVKLGEAVQTKCDQDFLGQLKELKDRVVAVEKDIDAKPESSLDRLSGLTVELTKLEESSPQVSAAARKPAALLRARLKTLGAEVYNVNARLKHEDQIAAACGDPARFCRQLSEYVRLYPQARRSVGFKEAMEESELWEWLAQWNEMVHTLGRESPTKIDRKAATEQAAKLKTVLKQRAGHPDAEAFERRLTYLEAVARRTNSEGEPIEAAIKPLLADPLVAGAWMILDKKSGLKYYLLEDPEPTLGQLGPGGLCSFEYVVRFDLTKKRKGFRRDDIATDRLLAPQRALARKLGEVLDSLTDENWESSFCKMVEAIRGDTETDPLLRLVLLQKVLIVACQGAVSFQKAFGPHLATLKQAKVPPGMNWMDPNDSEAKRLRPEVANLLSSLPNFVETRNTAATEWRSLLRPIGTEFQPVGWLRKKTDDQWQCVMRAGLQGSGKLWIVKAVEGGTKTDDERITAVGRLDQGKAVIDANAGTALLEGRPVYLALPPAK